MADGQEREWYVYLAGPAGTVEVVVRAAGEVFFGGTEVHLGDARFSMDKFMGAFPRELVTATRIAAASR